MIFALLCAKLSMGVASRTYTDRSYRRDGLAWLAVFAGGAVLAFVNLNPSLVVSVGYVILVALVFFNAAMIYIALRRAWLLTAPINDARPRVPPVADFVPMTVALFGMVLALVTATTVPPKPELYLSTGAESGVLHPITALPNKIALDNHTWISDLIWTEVGPDRLRASGVLNKNNCEPSCADGVYTRSGVEVRAEQPVLCKVDVYPSYADVYYTVRSEIYTMLVSIR